MAALIDCWWALDATADPGAMPPAILPDGHVELAFHLGDPMLQVLADGSRQRQPRALVIGQMSSATTLQPSGRVSAVGVRLRPAGVRAMLRVSAAELTDRIEDLGAVDPSMAARVMPGDAWPAGERAAREIERRLTEALQGRRPDLVTARVVTSIERSGGRAPIDDLVRVSGIGARDLERRFRREVGLSPKAFSRVIRFQRAVTALVDDSPRLIDAALSGGYYDQAHFTREFKAFARVPPNVWFSRDCQLSMYFTAAHRERGRSISRHLCRRIAADWE